MTRVSAQRVACHENLECLLSADRGSYHHAVAEDAAAFALYSASLPRARLVPFRLTRGIRPFLNDDAMLRHSNLGQALEGAKVAGFVPSYRSSPLLERWSQDAGIQLLSPSIRLQRHLEHKIHFHRLLQQHDLPSPPGLAVNRPEELDGIARFPVVCQRPSGEGMTGTFLVRSPRQLRDDLTGGTLRLPLLCRDFVSGSVLGITIVVGTQEILLSAVRHQCRGLIHGKKDLLGVQWMAVSRLSKAVCARINKTMEALGGALRGAGFLGAANVDFILSGEQVLILECNPRFSAATPQLSFERSLLHGLDFFAEYLRAVQGRRLSAHRPRLPRSDFEGACVDFSEWSVAIMKAAGRRVVSEMPRLGVYDFSSDRLRFVSSDIADLRGRDRLLFHYSTPAGLHVGAKSDLGSLLTNLPLFYYRGSRALLSRRGALLLEQLQRAVVFTRPSLTLADLAASPPRRRARGGS